MKSVKKNLPIPAGITHPKEIRFLVYPEPIHMGCGFPTLEKIVTRHRQKHGGQGLYLFFNKKKDYVKVFYEEKGGVCIWAKKLTFKAKSLDVAGEELLRPEEISHILQEEIVEDKKIKKLLAA